MHPPIEPYDQGHLAVGDGHLIYWEVCGNPALIVVDDSGHTGSPATRTQILAALDGFAG